MTTIEKIQKLKSITAIRYKTGGITKKEGTQLWEALERDIRQDQRVNADRLRERMGFLKGRASMISEGVKNKASRGLEFSELKNAFETIQEIRTRVSEIELLLNNQNV